LGASRVPFVHLGSKDSFVLFQKISDDPQRREQCGKVAQSLHNAISHRVLRIIYRHLGAVVGALNGSFPEFRPNLFC
jgi:hypothetical protein